MSLLGLVLAVAAPNLGADVLHDRLAALPTATAKDLAQLDGDWLVDGAPRASFVGKSKDGRDLILANGLVRLEWRIAPNVARIAFDELSSNRSILRAVEPEARVTLDGVELDVGGLTGQVDRAFLAPSDVDRLVANPKAFACFDFEVGAAKERMAWKRVRHSEDRPWPPPGRSIRFDFAAGDSRDTVVHVHYEMFDGLPLVSKWIEVENRSAKPITVDHFECERLAAVESSSWVETPERFDAPDLTVFSDFAFGGGDLDSTNRVARWLEDPAYTTQVNYGLHTHCLLSCAPSRGPEARVLPNTTFESFRVFELAQDSTERERRGLAIRRAFRTIAPWITENPLMMHCTRSDDAGVRAAIDQCADVGFEMLILSFGSGFDLENRDPKTLATAKAWADYARSKNVEIGSYSLLSSRSIGPDTDVIDERTGKPGGAMFGSAPCLESKWGRDYFARLREFHEQSGFTLLEHDGSYPGDFCASTTHGHTGVADSQWMQWKTISNFYAWCRGRGIFLNVPDFYYLAGSNKCGMGYRETNWSLPRELQLLHARQNIFDGTWTKTPSMGWMFVPLTEYQGGGAAATIEPLAEHLDVYEAHLAINLGAGVQACWRGPRLYDSPKTKELVARWVAFFKLHRAILESDLVHLRRPDGRDVDFYLHVNPKLDERAFAMLFNPLDEAVDRALELPLAYAGLRGEAFVREHDGEARRIALDATSSAKLDVHLPPHGFTWFVFSK